MEQPERLKQMKAALVDFLFRADEIPRLEEIILFGSLLEGDVSKKSDIDLLLVFNSRRNPETGFELKTATKISIEVLKNYQIENNFSFITVNTKTVSKTDKDFLIETVGKGQIVWQKRGLDFLKKHQELKVQVLFNYSTKNTSSANKRKLLRRLSKLIGFFGKKIGRGVFVVDYKQENKAESLLKECRASYGKRQILS